MDLSLGKIVNWYQLINVKLAYDHILFVFIYTQIRTYWSGNPFEIPGNLGDCGCAQMLEVEIKICTQGGVRTLFSV